MVSWQDDGDSGGAEFPDPRAPSSLIPFRPVLPGAARTLRSENRSDYRLVGRIAFVDSHAAGKILVGMSVQKVHDSLAPYRTEGYDGSHPVNGLENGKGRCDEAGCVQAERRYDMNPRAWGILALPVLLQHADDHEGLQQSVDATVLHVKPSRDFPATDGLSGRNHLLENKESVDKTLVRLGWHHGEISITEGMVQ